MLAYWMFVWFVVMNNYSNAMDLLKTPRSNVSIHKYQILNVYNNRMLYFHHFGNMNEQSRKCRRRGRKCWREFDVLCYYSFLVLGCFNLICDIDICAFLWIVFYYFTRAYQNVYVSLCCDVFSLICNEGVFLSLMVQCICCSNNN
jgi:hypothetical protein